MIFIWWLYPGLKEEIVKSEWFPINKGQWVTLLLLVNISTYPGGKKNLFVELYIVNWKAFTKTQAFLAKVNVDDFQCVITMKTKDISTQ